MIAYNMDHDGTMFLLGVDPKEIKLEINLQCIRLLSQAIDNISLNIRNETQQQYFNVFKWNLLKIYF